MAEINADIQNQLLEPNEILQEAKQRWLQPAEVCQILTNYEQFELRTSRAERPPDGSLYLYDKNLIRYFRKDNHNWKKKYGKRTAKEDHQKLKVDGVNVLHCYCAYGETDEDFQRRIYVMIDQRFGDHVLVHYREVNKGCMSDVPSVQNADSGTLLSQSSQQTTSLDETQNTSYGLEYLFHSELDENALNPDPDTYMWMDVDGSMKNAIRANCLSHKQADSTRLDDNVCHSEDLFSSGTGFSLPHAGAEGIHTSVTISDNDNDTGRLKKLDSFERWMDDSLMATPSYWDVLETEKDKNRVSSLSHHIQMDTDFVGPSLANEQLFSISDFAPDWAYSGTETKVLITGTFLGEKKHMSGIKWCCMFGETEVVAEVVTENAIRCTVPPHGAGCVPFYLTSSNRIACSELKEFEYVKRPSKLEDSDLDAYADAEDEFGLLVRFSKLLSSGIERKWLACLVENCEKCKLKDVFHSLIIDKEGCWKRITEVFKGNSKELLIQNLLKDKLYERLVCEAHELCQGLRTLDEKGQGVIHLAAALGYVWAINPIAAAGLSPNFRDARGWTALHWASLYGREETIVTLVKLGAFAGAVDNPTPKNPCGRTAADLAVSKGHKGIAGYLAEADIMSLFSALSVKKKAVVGKEIEEHGGSVAAAAATAAVRRSEDASAFIEKSFRARFFHKIQVSTSSIKNSNLTPEEEGVVAAAVATSHRNHKSGHYEDYMGVYASKIQRKYRRWTNKKNFLSFRGGIVKIQAHFRGHKVRKQYKKVVWSVGIMEKAVLRWRQKRKGLRGFRPELTYPSEVEKGEYDFLHIGQKQKHDGVKNALAIVHSMASHSQAQDQYLRMLRVFEKLSNEEKKEDSRRRD